MSGGGGMGVTGVGNTTAGADIPAGGSTSTVVTFTVEILLYTAVLTASCWFASHYFAILRMPALVFIFTDPVSVMASLQAVSMILVFSVRPKSVGGAFSDGVLAEVSQGFAVVSSLMWMAFLGCMFIEVPRITAVPGFPASASAITLAVVLGFSVVIPFLALVVTYAAVPAGSGNSLIFNGSTVGAACLLFFVIVSFGNGGVLKCSPDTDNASNMLFYALVLSYWGMLFVVEMAVFSDPLESIWGFLGYDAAQYHRFINSFGLSWLDIDVWRILGCIVNVAIVATSLFYVQSSMQSTVWVVIFVVIGLHIPLIFTLKFDWFSPGKVYENYQLNSWRDGRPPARAPFAVPVRSSISSVQMTQLNSQNSGVADAFPFNSRNSTSSVEKRHRHSANDVGIEMF
jgi:hypothetical protein